ncbi:Reverse transcriptase zinc-binding domain [Macleaya cordata]|uniref:Reverse transcriptase zinc-binding domain n=1 Tax=Macleaya cordata TaxID=56857 RepID=A0A200R8R9_MACCD|nr:Reverse transcriptase zinc-binding domain [Macleaya cordata]
MDNLTHRGTIVINRCPMCKHELESINHLFLHCEMARDILCFFHSEFGVDWVLPAKVTDYFLEKRVQHFSKIGNFFWVALPFGITWNIWKERNVRVFDGGELVSL